MSAQPIQAWMAWCEQCGWESETDDSQSWAEKLSDRHNDEKHADDDEFDHEDEPKASLGPFEEYQAALDAAMEAFR